MTRLALLLCSALVTAVALAGCSTPQVVQATDCRGATKPCGIVYAPADAHAMTTVPVTVPIGGLP